MPNQIATFTLNGDTDGSTTVVSHSLSFTNKTEKATVVVSLLHSFGNDSPIFDWWFSNEAGKVEIAIVNLNMKDGENQRDIVLENAICTTYSESYNGTTGVMDDVCYPIATCVIEAESITMGGTSFPE
jgi:hypothetical protein